MGKYKQLSVLTLKIHGSSRDENAINQLPRKTMPVGLQAPHLTMSRMDLESSPYWSLKSRYKI